MWLLISLQIFSRTQSSSLCFSLMTYRTFTPPFALALPRTPSLSCSSIFDVDSQNVFVGSYWFDLSQVLPSPSTAAQWQFFHPKTHLRIVLVHAAILVRPQPEGIFPSSTLPEESDHVPLFICLLEMV